MRLTAGLLMACLMGCSDREHPPAATAQAAAAEAPVAVPPPAQPEKPAAMLVMDVMQVVGRSEAEVSALLGPPSSCEDIHRARLCRYAPHADEVMFVKGAADMITVQAMDAIAFNEDALAALGLAAAKPDHADANAIRWTSIAGLEEVSVFPGQGTAVDYGYVKVGKH